MISVLVPSAALKPFQKGVGGAPRLWLFLCGLVLLTGACGVSQKAPKGPATLFHEAYVWQRLWNEPLGEAVANPPQAIGALRVLVAEVDPVAGRSVELAPDAMALAASGREVVLVLRVAGSRKIDQVTLGTLLERAQALGLEGVDVRGIEVDYDCPTARLGDYAAWLAREQDLVAKTGLVLSITALPDWGHSTNLPALAAQVDHAVLQVHAIEAPVLFEPQRALLQAQTFAKAWGKPFWLALPSYRARLRDGRLLAAKPQEVRKLIEAMDESPPVGFAGFVWFRLGHRGDDQAWSASTLQAVIRGEILVHRIEAALAPLGPGRHDIVLINSGAIDGPAPGSLHLAGRLQALEGVAGYRRVPSGLVADQPPWMQAGARITVGFVLGEEVSLALD